MSTELIHLLNIYFSTYIQPILLQHNTHKCPFCKKPIININVNPVNLTPIEFHEIFYHNQPIPENIQIYLLKNKHTIISKYHNYLNNQL